MSDSQTWDVPCYVCGFKLGSNKAGCGQAQAGKKAVKFPPCKWAHTDDKYVRRAHAEVAAAAAQKAKEEEEQRETMARYHAGQINFTEEREEDDTEANQNGAFLIGDEAGGDAGGELDGGEANAADASTPTKETKAKRSEHKHTKWSSLTRTMFYKCIQAKDPFNKKDKAGTWEAIAVAMQEATLGLANTADGDFRVHANGKTLNVFYGRCKKAFKEREDNDKHSGTAGRLDDDNPASKMKKEEREQLWACIDLEKSAEEQVQLKRDATKSYDFIKNGVVNDFVVDCASKDEKVKPKLVQELSSRLRQAKMRKIAFEQTNKGGMYTYTAEDMENFRLWDKVREADAQLPEAEDIDGDIPASKKGGQLVTALKELTAQGAQLRQHFTPMSPSEFASEFFKAKRAHADAIKLTLAQKLAMVTDDVAGGTITPAEGEAFKKRIKDEHYSFSAP
jgi:flagellar biosynthesis regulator FlaF